MKKKDAQSLFDKMDWEGVDYAIYDYSDWKEVKDEKFHELRNKSMEARDELNAYLMQEALRNNIETDIEL